MQRAIIIHCWEGYPNYCWYPWAQQELEKRGFEVKVPAFPDTDLPQQDKWVPYLAEQAGEPDENLFLIGHSLGCITILRYLESLPAGKKIGGVVFVAGYIGDLGYDELKNFFETPVDFKKVRSHCDKFVAIHSDNDPYVALEQADIFKKELDAEIVVKHAMDHFSGALEGEKSCTELPDVVSAVARLISK